MSSARIAALLKDYGWVLNLVFIGLAAYFVAGAANAVLARAIRTVPTVDDVAAAQNSHASQQQRPKVGLTSVASRNLFNVKREELTPKAAGDADAGGMEAGESFDGKELKPCTVAATLSATLVSSTYPEWSVAVLVNNTTHEPEVYSINQGANQIADDATLVDIRYREVVVRRRDHFELCSTEGNTPVAVAMAQPTADTGGDGVTKVSETQLDIDGAFLDKQLSDMNQIMQDARVVPSYQNGKANGFKLFSIKPDSLYQKIGLQNGDVISKINGYEMSSPDKALEIYAKLKDAQSIQVDLKRRGRDMNMNYTVKR
jgi:general secretion pathway protein C